MGVRWWTPFDETVPRRPTVLVPRLKQRGEPVFSVGCDHGRAPTVIHSREADEDTVGMLRDHVARWEGDPDRIAVLHEGRLEQVDTPQKVLTEPATPFVRELFEKPARQLAVFRGGT